MHGLRSARLIRYYGRRAISGQYAVQRSVGLQLQDLIIQFAKGKPELAFVDALDRFPGAPRHMHVLRAFLSGTQIKDAFINS